MCGAGTNSNYPTHNPPVELLFAVAVSPARFDLLLFQAAL